VLATAKPGKLQITKSPATGRTLSCENVEKGGNWNDREELSSRSLPPKPDREKRDLSGWRPRRPLTPPGSFLGLLRHNGTRMTARRRESVRGRTAACQSWQGTHSQAVNSAPAIYGSARRSAGSGALDHFRRLLLSLTGVIVLPVAVVLLGINPAVDRVEGLPPRLALIRHPIE